MKIIGFQIDWFQYGFCILKKLPYKLTKDSDGGCFVEVEVVIPVKLHEYLNDIPPFPESCSISAYMTSQTTKNLRANRLGEECNVKPMKKLALNFFRCNIF